MTHYFFTVMPLFVVFFWLILFLLDIKKNGVAKRFLTLFLGVALVNYLAHWFYFNNNYSVYRLLDSVWVFTSLRSEEHTSELQSRPHLVCRLLLEKKKEQQNE